MKMPILVPIPIKTKGLSRLGKVKVWLTESRKWKLHEDWKYDTCINGDNITIFIKSGFIFDGASIPRPLWWLFNPMGIFMVPGLVHDYAYRHQKIVLTDEGHIFNPIQKYWDDIFRQISTEVNGMPVCSYAAWTALRIFGSSAWKKNRKLQAVREQWEHHAMFMPVSKFGKDSINSSGCK